MKIIKTVLMSSVLFFAAASSNSQQACQGSCEIGQLCNSSNNLPCCPSSGLLCYCDIVGGDEYGMIESGASCSPSEARKIKK